MNMFSSITVKRISSLDTALLLSKKYTHTLILYLKENFKNEIK